MRKLRTFILFLVFVQLKQLWVFGKALRLSLQLIERIQIYQPLHAVIVYYFNVKHLTNVVRFLKFGRGHDHYIQH